MSCVLSPHVRCHHTSELAIRLTQRVLRHWSGRSPHREQITARWALPGKHCLRHIERGSTDYIKLSHVLPVSRYFRLR